MDAADVEFTLKSSHNLGLQFAGDCWSYAIGVVGIVNIHRHGGGEDGDGWR